MLYNGSPYTSSCPLVKTQFLRNGKLLYSLKKVFLITKESSSFLVKNSAVSYFYFLTKMPQFHNISELPEAEEDDVLIDSMQSLISSLTRKCFIDKPTDYKITVYTDKYRPIDSDNVLLSYRGNVLFVKANPINEFDSNKFLLSPKRDIPRQNNNSPSSNNKSIKNTLLKFRLHLSKTSFRNTQYQRKCTNKYYPLREKKILSPHMNSEPFRYSNYNRSFEDLIESGREPLVVNKIKTPLVVKLPSHYLSYEKLPLRHMLRNKCKYVFNSNLYPIDQDSQISKPLAMTQSKSCQDITVIRKLKTIHKYLGFRRDCGSTTHNHPNTVIYYSNLDSIKQAYTSLVSAFREYINSHLDNAIKQTSLSIFTLPFSLLFHQQYPKFAFGQCQKEFIFYSFISYQFDLRHPGLLQSLKQTHNNMKPSDVISHINEYKDILNELISRPIKIIQYALGKKEPKLSSAFFQIFILCYNFFDTTQSALSDIMMMILRITTTNPMSFGQFSDYYLYFRQYELLHKEKQYLFLKKIITYIMNQHNSVLNDLMNQNDEGADSETKRVSIKKISPKMDKDDLLDTFRTIFELSEPLLQVLLAQYDWLTSMKIKRKQAKLDLLFERVIGYFNKT